MFLVNISVVTIALSSFVSYWPFFRIFPTEISERSLLIIMSPIPLCSYYLCMRVSGRVAVTFFCTSLWACCNKRWKSKRLHLWPSRSAFQTHWFSLSGWSCFGKFMTWWAPSSSFALLSQIWQFIYSNLYHSVSPYCSSRPPTYLYVGGTGEDIIYHRCRTLSLNVECDGRLSFSCPSQSRWRTKQLICPSSALAM